MLTLLAALLMPQIADDPGHAGPAATQSPPIQITLNDGSNFMPGGLVNVRIQTNDDGYLLVFRVDADGRIRVLFPLDPDADAFVRGGKEYELRGRGDRGTFFADDRGGTGMVYAALARQSFNVRDVSANGHWDYDALRLPDSTTDAENDLTAIVSRMTNRARFDYDAVGYRVQDIAPTVGVSAGGGYYASLYDPFYNPAWRCLGCGWGYPGSDVAVGFGYSPFWDPWLFSPWGFTYGYGFGYGYTGSNWWYGRNYPVGIGHGPRPAPPPGTRVRPRDPAPVTGTHSVTPPPSAPPTRGRPAPNSPPPPPPSRTGSPPSSTGTRSRPRPSDEAVVPQHTVYAPTNPSTYVRPVFRQPQTEMPVQPRQEQPQVRPVYREPPQPQVNRAPPPSQQPQARSAPSSPPPAPSVRSVPPPASTTTSRPRGGGR